MLLRDGSGLLQCTVGREAVGEELYGRLEGLPLESALELSGTVREDGRAPGGWELSVSGAGAIYPAKLDYPLVKKEHGVEFLADNRHLYVRDPRLQNIFQIRATFL